MGCAIYPDDGEELGELLEKADQAMYDVKRSKKTSRE
ncbi:diguanylate cyclase domain-containing protein [Mesorhizobium caraganae]|nr:diguanylate cyclase [Mesorhizobium caraganae]